MTRSRIIVLIAATLLFPAAAARADCAYDMGQLKGRLASEPDKMKAAAVRKQLAKAADAQPTSETECDNAVARGWKALRATAEPPARAPNTAMAPNYSDAPYNTPNHNAPSYNGQNYNAQY